MRFSLLFMVVLAALILPPYALGQAGPFNVVSPFAFDPERTQLVQSAWLTGIGCPDSDPACSTADTQDSRNEGLLLVKTGPTSTFASAGAELHSIKDVVLNELGYDIRKSGPAAGPLGSHCGAGAPRFNVVINGVTHFIGCNSPPPTSSTLGTGWVRLRWGGGAPSTPLLAFNSISGAFVNIRGLTADRILILFDEGQDPSGGPDQFGAAVLDNVDVNGVMVGRGSGSR